MIDLLDDAAPYPRDLVGYGRHAPDPRWPGGARIAVNFVVNYEEGGESSILHGDAVSEGFLGELPDSPPLAGRRDLGQESVYEYGSRAGFWRLHRLFTQRGVPVTVFAVGMALARNPAAARAMDRAGWEIASHAWRWIDYADMPPERERQFIARAVACHEALLGHRPVGYYGSRISENTRRLVVEERGFLYDSDDYSDDLPFWNVEHGRPHLVIPYTLDTNDMRFASPAGFENGESFERYLSDAFDYLYAEGATSPKLLTIGLHCRLTGRPGRAAGLARFIDRIVQLPEVWICRRDQIARHWHATHPPKGHDA
ncbi:allantoinase PuuE [Microbacterium sp.]|uniref:allantoinase PuuE n=1 Tax=Microbacterium sp. TaxID=51671 RepID=UPI002810B884|nr:allantoinase PuuE [Microbacterium sp.]